VLIGSAEANQKTSDKMNYIQCAAIELMVSNVGRLSRNPEKFATPIPKGWSVVGTADGDKSPKVIVCR